MIKNFREIVSQLKTEIPIQDLISEYVSLRKSGRGHVGLCPFHDDKKPSMHVHPQKGIYKCFSCGAGGDLIAFYANINNKKWGEAVPELASKYGIQVQYEEEDSTESKIKKELIEVNKTAMKFFQKNLKEESKALDYLLKERKLKEETIENFKVGYATNNWTHLYDYLSKEKEISNELIFASGLVIQKENGNGYYDRFRGRIIFPIFDEFNNVVAFGGRILPSLATDKTAKYINSPETLLYLKSTILYGFNYAKENIKEKDYAILSEGYLDVITAHEYGLNNTVASMGTALSKKQLRLLTKNTNSKKLCLCLDSDAAGLKAVEGIFRTLQEMGDLSSFDVRVTSNLPKKDIDESLRSEGLEPIAKIISNGQKLLHFILDSACKLYISAKEQNNDIEKNDALNELCQIILSTKDPIGKTESVSYVSHKLGLEEEVIRYKVKELENKEKRRGYYSKKTTKESKENDPFKMYSNERFKHAELELLLLYLTSFPETEEVRTELNKIDFIDEKSILIKEFLDNIESPAIRPEEVINELILEFNEYKHIMSLISELSLKIDRENSEELSKYTKKKGTILNEAKESISWWNTNKKDMKGLTQKLKYCTSKEEEEKILSEMMKIVSKEDA